MPYEHLKRHFIDFKHVAFWVGKEAGNDFKLSFDYLKHRFSTSAKLNFGLVKRQKMSSQTLATA